jgi:hypothetical protein
MTETSFAPTLSAQQSCEQESRRWDYVYTHPCAHPAVNRSALHNPDLLVRASMPHFPSRSQRDHSVRRSNTNWSPNKKSRLASQQSCEHESRRWDYGYTHPCPPLKQSRASAHPAVNFAAFPRTGFS